MLKQGKGHLGSPGLTTDEDEFRQHEEEVQLNFREIVKLLQWCANHWGERKLLSGPNQMGRVPFVRTQTGRPTGEMS